MSYRNLIRDLKSIVHEGLVDRKHDFNLATTLTNWELGKRLVIEEQSGTSRAAYGMQILEKVSAALKKVYGRGFGIANLRYMRQFYQMYRKEDLQEELQWSHYRLLVQVNDSQLRKKLEKKIIKDNWGYRELLLQIQKKQATDENDLIGDQLIRPSGVLGIGQVRRIVEQGRELVFLDPGFNLWIPDIQNKLDAYADDQLVFVAQEKAEWKTKAYVGEKDNRWLFKAWLDRVVDGDTIIVFVEMCLGIRTRQILRLQSINTAPLSEIEGLAARDFIKNQLEQASTILLKTRKKDKYARYVADVIIGKTDEDETKVLKTGIFLNQALLDQKLAIRVK